MESLVELLIPLAGILFPVAIVFVIFSFITKIEKNKYDAIVEISKRIDDPSAIEEILNTLNDKKKPIDYRRGGVITLFVGVGIVLLGNSFASIDNGAQAFISGAGLLVAAIGVGSIIAGYLYPNESAEISKAVEKFEG
jgi:branched-subunit amino acid permease